MRPPKQRHVTCNNHISNYPLSSNNTLFLLTELELIQFINA